MLAEKVCEIQPGRQEAFAERLDEYGRVVWPDGRLTKTEGPICDQVSCFLDKPKVFVAGSTGELGRRAVLDMLRTGMSIYCGVRDEGRMYEVQYKNRSSSKYEMTVIQDAFIEGGREEVLISPLATHGGMGWRLAVRPWSNNCVMPLLWWIWQVLALVWISFESVAAWTTRSPSAAICKAPRP
eukprot:symbB.v1.2.011755.t1/scaffold750.1/size323489/7